MIVVTWSIVHPSNVVIPARQRTKITRSRGAINSHHHFQPAHWPAHVVFAQATGLRRSDNTF